MSATRRRYAPVALFFLLGISAWVSAEAGIMDKLKGVLGSDKTTALTDGEIGAGLKEALRVGTETVVNRLGQANGFNADPKIHIPLPSSLAKAKKALSKVGLGSYGEALEEKLNHAAEAATPKAKALFLQAISDMTLDDVRQIYNGPQDAATTYFKNKMSPALAAEMKPIVDSSLADVGALSAYDSFIGKYKDLPFVPNVRADLSTHVVNKAMDGIFYYVAEEEAAIRANPAKRTTEILKKVFGQ